MLQLLDKMFVDTDRKSVTYAMLAVAFGPGALLFVVMWPEVIMGLVFFTILMFVGWQLPKLVIKAVQWSVASELSICA